MILGLPTLGDGELPGQSCGLEQPSWEEFLPTLPADALAGKVVASYNFV